MISSSAQLKIAKPRKKQDSKALRGTRVAGAGNLTIEKQADILQSTELEMRAREISAWPEDKRHELFIKLRAEIQDDLKKRSYYRSLRALVQTYTV